MDKEIIIWSVIAVIFGSIWAVLIIDEIIKFIVDIRKNKQLLKKMKTEASKMKKQDIRMDIVDRLETYCGERGVSFYWAEEKMPKGSLVVKFTYNGKSFTHRVTPSEIENLNCGVELITKKLIVMVEEFLYKQGGSDGRRQ